MPRYPNSEMMQDIRMQIATSMFSACSFLKYVVFDGFYRDDGYYRFQVSRDDEGTVADIVVRTVAQGTKRYVKLRPGFQL